MIGMTARLVGLLLILATAALPVRAETVLLNDAQKKEAAAALDQRIGCAAFYRVTFEILTTRNEPSPRTRDLVRDDYDAAGKDMLVQASALAGALGKTNERVTLKFKTAVAALRERIDGLSIAYNQLARRLHPACQRLIQR
jgi:hypothetical protein